MSWDKSDWWYSKISLIRYWCGVYRYRLTHPAAYGKYREKLRAFLAAIEEALIKLHGMQLGAYRHHDPRPAHKECFPVRQVPINGHLSFAIVTPSYNQAKYIGKTIASVVGQNHPRLQYAVMDGASNDGSQEEIEKYADDLTVFVSESDKGQSAAIQKGFSKVSGDIMAYLNSDDMLMPGVLKYVEEYFQQHPEVDVIYGHRVIVDELGKQIGRWVLPPHSNRETEYFDFIPQETMFWRKRIWDKVGGIDPSFQFAMDWDLILRFMAAGATFRRLPYYLAYFRSHDSQKSHLEFGSRGQQEIEALLARVHDGNVDRAEFHRRSKAFRRKAILCTLLLDLGIRV
jgi:glycosyltransferase involved in cell wall biosynthesis